MARDSDDIRFPLRRATESGEDAEARAWAPKRADPPALDIRIGKPAEQPQPKFVPDPFWRRRAAAAPPLPPAPPTADAAPAADGGDYTTNVPAIVRRSRWRWLPRGVAALILLLGPGVAWLARTAPLSKSLQPPAPPSIPLLSAEGKPIARRGAVIAAPVDAARLPRHVRDAFISIEDR